MRLNRLTSRLSGRIGGHSCVDGSSTDTVSSLDSPLVIGPMTVGQQLTAYDGLWPDSPSITRRWLADGVAISGATGTTYTLTASEEGAMISLEVTTDTGGFEISAERGPVTTEATELTTFDSALSSGGVTAELDALWILARDTAANAKVNRINPGTYDLTEVSAPTFTARKGFKSAGSGSYLDTGINPSLGGFKFLQDDNSFGLWCFDSVDNSLASFGYGGVLMNPMVSSGARVRNASTTNDTTTGMLDSRGLQVSCRSSSTQHDQYIHGEYFNYYSRTSASLANGVLRVCGWSDGTANHYSTARTLALAFVGGALTQAQVKTLRDAAGRFFLRTGVIKPYVKQIEAGIPTTSGFTVSADIEFAHDPTIRTRLVVTTDADTTFASPVFIGDWTTISPTTYHCGVRHTATGLSAATDYRYRVEIDAYQGTLPDGGTQLLTGTLTTAPSGATAFRMVVGSCWLRTTSVGSTIAALIAAQSPDFYISMGDDNYDDNADGDRTKFLAKLAAAPLELKRSRRYGWRGRGRWSERKTLNQAVPHYYIPDDHDFVSNDMQIGDTVSGSVKFEDINGDVMDAYLEIVPHPTLIDEGNSLAAKFEWGNCAFVAIDSTSQRDEANGRMVNTSQLTALCDAITEAGSSGKTLLFLLSPNTWQSSNEGWQSNPGAYQTQHTALNDHIKDTLDLYPQLRVVLLVGDMHKCAADDGAVTDYSTGGMGGKMVQFVCSPWNSTSLNSGTFTWMGSAASHASSDNMLAVLDVNADNTNVAVEFFNIASGSAVSVATYDTADLTAW